MTTLHSALLPRSPHAGAAALYKSLMKEYVSSFGNTDVRFLSENRTDLKIDGIHFSLSHMPKVDWRALQISAVALEIQPGQEAALYQTLLASNFHLHSKGCPVLALAPQEPLVLALMRLPLRQTTAPMLANVLNTMVQAVMELRSELVK